MDKKILVLTDMDFKGSGYYYLMSPILHNLAKLGYDIKIIGLSYTGEEHQFDFSIIPCANVQDGVAIINNLVHLWKPDLFICGMDIPMQIAVHNAIRQHNLKYIAVTPLENPPLTPSWAIQLMQMDYVFFISELGKQAALKAGLSKVDHLTVGIDSKSFYPADAEERKSLRKDFGYADDEFVILTVADNQERKNLWAAIQIVSQLKKMGHKVRYSLVTRIESQVGYKLQDLLVDAGIHKETVLVERGIPQEDLRKLYAASNLFLLTSKAEGLGIPMLEAIACYLPCAGTDTGAIHEILDEGRGYLLPSAYEFIDVWGNSSRSMVNINESANIISKIIEECKVSPPTAPNKAMLWLRERDLRVSVDQMDKVIKEILQ